MPAPGVEFPELNECAQVADGAAGDRPALGGIRGAAEVMIPELPELRTDEQHRARPVGRAVVRVCD